MTYAVNPSISRIEAPPIMEAQTWIRLGLRNFKLPNLRQVMFIFNGHRFLGVNNLMKCAGAIYRDKVPGNNPSNRT